MKIALIRSPWITVSSYPPDIGFSYIATMLKNRGHELLLIDLNIEFYRKIEETERNRLDCCNAEIMLEFGKITCQKYDFILDDAVKRILKFAPQVAGFCVWESNKLISLELARRVKQMDPSVSVIFGGPDCYPLFSGREFAQDPRVDLVIYGEAEITFTKVLDSIKASGKFVPIPGLIFRHDGNIIDSGSPDVIMNLDGLPMLDLEDFPLDLYGQRSLPISFNRGCAYKCEYCPREMYPSFRNRGPENVVAEIEYQVERCSINSFLVCDATITSNLRQVIGICDLILSKGMKVSFGGFASTHPALDNKVLVKLRKAGFRSFVYGVESGSEEVLSRFGKKIKLQTIEKVIKDTYEAGIDVGVDILIGLPGETEEDFIKTTDFLVRNRKYIRNIGINSFGLKPYSYIFSYAKQFNFVPEEIKFARMSKLKELVESLKLTETVERRLPG